jgi:hypothetical protein
MIWVPVFLIALTIHLWTQYNTLEEKPMALRFVTETLTLFLMTVGVHEVYTWFQ